MKTDAVPSYANSAIHPEDEFALWARRIFTVRETAHRHRAMPVKTNGRSYKSAFQPAREPQRYEPGKNWKFRHVQRWPAQHGIIKLVDIGPYRNHGRGNYAGMVRAQCACGTTLWIACGTWLGAALTKPCPDQCEGCRRGGHRKIDYTKAHEERRAKAKARAWIGDDVTLARAKKASAGR